MLTSCRRRFFSITPRKNARVAPSEGHLVDPSLYLIFDVASCCLCERRLTVGPDHDGIIKSNVRRLVCCHMTGVVTMVMVIVLTMSVGYDATDQASIHCSTGLLFTRWQEIVTSSYSLTSRSSRSLSENLPPLHPLPRATVVFYSDECSLSLFVLQHPRVQMSFT